jgi:predicted secreted protein with PEFG-CTERM motif
MKAYLSMFALSIILIANIGLSPAFGQSSIVVNTDKTSYSEGDTILVTGEISQILGGFSLSLIMKAPNGNLVTIDQITVGSDKKFSTNLAAGGSLMKIGGTYTITIQYGDNKNQMAETSFEFGGSTTIPTTDDSSKVTNTTVSVQGSNNLLGYEITGGKLLSVIPDVDANSLIISIDAVNDGSLTLTIPRSVMDATINGEDDDFFVLVDDEEVDFDEITTSTDRTITITFPAGAETIEIIGTFVIPEFGTIAAMILAVAIISIIAISSKSRLSIIPRY